MRINPAMRMSGVANKSGQFECAASLEGHENEVSVHCTGEMCVQYSTGEVCVQYSTGEVCVQYSTVQYR